MRSVLFALFTLALCGLFAADAEASCRPRHGRRGCNRGEGRLLHRHHREGRLFGRRHMEAAPEQLSAPKPVKLKEMPKAPPAPVKPAVTVTYENVPAIAPFIDWSLPVEVLPAPGD